MRKIKKATLKKGQFLLLCQTTRERLGGAYSEGIADLFFLQTGEQLSKHRGLLLGSMEACSLLRAENKQGSFHLRRTVRGEPSVVHYKAAYVMSRTEAMDYIDEKQAEFTKRAKNAQRFSESFDALARKFITSARAS